MRGAGLVFLLVLLLLCLPGCPERSPPYVDPPITSSSCSQFVGDPQAPPRIDLVYRTADGRVAPLTEGAMLPLTTPPQGGKMIFPGVVAHNMDTCAVEIVGAVRDECTNRVIGLEGRPVNLYLYDGQDGGTPAAPEQLSNFANVPLCPNGASSRNVNGEPYRLEVRVTDRAGRTASAMAHVVPTCAEPDRLLECLCTCRKGYRLGETCTTLPDAGPAGSCPTDAGIDAN